MDGSERPKRWQAVPENGPLPEGLTAVRALLEGGEIVLKAGARKHFELVEEIPEITIDGYNVSRAAGPGHPVRLRAVSSEDEYLLRYADSRWELLDLRVPTDLADENEFEQADASPIPPTRQTHVWRTLSEIKKLPPHSRAPIRISDELFLLPDGRLNLGNVLYDQGAAIREGMPGRGVFYMRESGDSALLMVQAANGPPVFYEYNVDTQIWWNIAPRVRRTDATASERFLRRPIRFLTQGYSQSVFWQAFRVGFAEQQGTSELRIRDFLGLTLIGIPIVLAIVAGLLGSIWGAGVETATFTIVTYLVAFVAWYPVFVPIRICYFLFKKRSGSAPRLATALVVLGLGITILLGVAIAASASASP